MTTKLHDLEKKEQDLREQMGVLGSDTVNPAGPTTSVLNRNNDDHFIAQSLQSGDEGLSPRSPFKSVIRAYLPNQQRTSVQVGVCTNLKD